jgi:sporulation protein YlmC with PRC-barrel domain
MGTFDTSRETVAIPANGGAAILADPEHQSAGPGPYVMDAATLHNDDVVSADGDSIGTIEAIMLDVASGRIAYAVLSFGGFLGMGSKYFAIPWSTLTLDATEKRFVVDISKEKLESAPGFDKDRWPAMADRRWATELHAHYDVSPYWEDEYGVPRDPDKATAERYPPMT